MFYLRGNFTPKPKKSPAERALVKCNAAVRLILVRRGVLAQIVQTERIDRELLKGEDGMAKKEHGKHAPHVASVEAAMDAAGTDPRARITAGIKAVMANTEQLKNPHDQREAAEHFSDNLDGFVSYAFDGKQ